VGNAWGGSVSLLTGAALWAGGRALGSPAATVVGFRGVEAITVSGLITKALKAGFGRARPRVDSLDPWNVEFGRGWDNDHESFPSGHSTAAFAFAAAVTSEVLHRAPARARLVGTTTFALAGVTAYARMHWLSDVTMGAAIGMASGWAVTRWHRTRPDNRIDATVLGGMSPLVVQGPQGRTLVGATIAWR
jgi:membrane-associated phospholipid phosphatase